MGLFQMCFKSPSLPEIKTYRGKTVKCVIFHVYTVSSFFENVWVYHTHTHTDVLCFYECILWCGTYSLISNFVIQLHRNVLIKNEATVYTKINYYFTFFSVHCSLSQYVLVSYKYRLVLWTCCTVIWSRGLCVMRVVGANLTNLYENHWQLSESHGWEWKLTSPSFMSRVFRVNLRTIKQNFLMSFNMSVFATENTAQSPSTSNFFSIKAFLNLLIWIIVRKVRFRLEQSLTMVNVAQEYLSNPVIC